MSDDLNPGLDSPRVFMEVQTIAPELITRGTWIFTHPDNQMPVLVESVMFLSDRHGRFVQVQDSKGTQYVFRPDMGDTVQMIV
jgi:hypothetical protein